MKFEKVVEVMKGSNEGKLMKVNEVFKGKLNCLLKIVNCCCTVVLFASAGWLDGRPAGWLAAHWLAWLT